MMSGIVMLAMFLGAGSASAQGNFDVNNDGVVDVADISCIVSAMAGNAPQISGAGEVNTKKQTSLLYPDKETKSESAGTAVDLGLPSMRLWADKNVGHSKDNKYGLYFAWGEVQGRKGYLNEGNDRRQFDWANYFWMSEGKSSWENIDKYQFPDQQVEADWYDEYGLFCGDQKGKIDSNEDAAKLFWGKGWRMPNYYDFKELLEYTTQTWEKDANGVYGVKFTGLKVGRDGKDWSSKSIFLPGAGYADDKYVQNRDGQYQFPKGRYWASDIYQHDSSCATSLSIQRKYGIEEEPECEITYSVRYWGLSIRPVKDDE
jgi:hypothetical protein